MFRKQYWEKPFDDKALEKIHEKTTDSLMEEIEKFLRKALTEPSHKQFRDGTQTKKDGNVVFYAQYATATCCRKSNNNFLQPVMLKIR